MRAISAPPPPSRLLEAALPGDSSLFLADARLRWPQAGLQENRGRWRPRRARALGYRNDVIASMQRSVLHLAYGVA